MWRILDYLLYIQYNDCLCVGLQHSILWGVYRGAVVTHSAPHSVEGGDSNPEPYVRKMKVSYQWSAVYSTEP